MIESPISVLVFGPYFQCRFRISSQILEISIFLGTKFDSNQDRLGKDPEAEEAERRRLMGLAMSL